MYVLFNNLEVKEEIRIKCFIDNYILKIRRIISNISPGTKWPVTYVITILGQEKKCLGSGHQADRF